MGSNQSKLISVLRLEEEKRLARILTRREFEAFHSKPRTILEKLLFKFKAKRNRNLHPPMFGFDYEGYVERLRHRLLFNILASLVKLLARNHTCGLPGIAAPTQLRMFTSAQTRLVHSAIRRTGYVGLVMEDLVQLQLQILCSYAPMKRCTGMDKVTVAVANVVGDDVPGIHFVSDQAKYEDKLRNLETFPAALRNEFFHRSLDKRLCWYCGSEGKTKACDSCKVARYCSIDCQKKAWRNHRMPCALWSNNPKATKLFKRFIDNWQNIENLSIGDLMLRVY